MLFPKKAKKTTYMEIKVEVDMEMEMEMEIRIRLRRFCLMGFDGMDE